MNVPQKVVVDTGALLIALALNYTNESKIAEKESSLMSAFSGITWTNSEIYDKAIDFFDKIRFFNCPAHVIGEVQGLTNSRLKLNNIEKSRFWEESVRYLKLKNLKEHCLSLIDFSNEERYKRPFKDIGFIDAELIKFSENLRLPIISTDKRTLMRYANGKELNHKNNNIEDRINYKDANVLILQDLLYL